MTREGVRSREKNRMENLVRKREIEWKKVAGRENEKMRDKSNGEKDSVCREAKNESV